MKIGVISDTHMPVKAGKFPMELVSVLSGCDLILHAGDLTEPYVLDDLKRMSKVEAVSGNMDSRKIESVLGVKKVLEVSGKKICLMHGYGRPEALIGMLKREFFADKPDIIVFGHSHVPVNKYIEGVLFFNPGSPTDTLFAPYRSYGIIEITNGKITADIRKL